MTSLQKSFNLLTSTSLGRIRSTWGNPFCHRVNLQLHADSTRGHDQTLVTGAVWQQLRLLYHSASPMVLSFMSDSGATFIQVSRVGCLVSYKW